MALKDHLGTILIAAIGVVTLILVVLIVIEKELYKKLIKYRGDRNRFYIKEVEKIDINDPEKALERINNLGMGFFIESFNIKRGTEYSKLTDFFNKNKKLEIAKFTNLMNDVLYTGKKATNKDIQILIALLINIIDSNPILTDGEREELRKKELRKTRVRDYLEKVKVFGVSKKKLENEQKDSK